MGKLEKYDVLEKLAEELIARPMTISWHQQEEQTHMTLNLRCRYKISVIS